MKLLLICAVIVIAAQVPQALSGVIMLTPNGLSYLNKDQYTQEKEMVMPATGQGDWRNDQNGQGGPLPQYQNDEEQEDDDEVDGDDEDKDNEDEDAKDKDADDEEDVEEKDDEDVAEKDKEDGAEKETEKDDAEDDDKPAESEEDGEPRNSHELQIKALKEQDKIAKLKAQDSEEAQDDEQEARPPPPPPADLVNKMQYEQMYGQYDQPASQPLLSRMTSLLTSMFRPSSSAQAQPQYGADPFTPPYAREAKALEAQRENSKVQKEPVETNEVITNRQRREAPVLSRSKRQINLRALNLAPFYHVRNNIRTTVRRQPVAKLAPEPLNDFSDLSEKASKPIKLIMEPYSAPDTLQSLNPKESVRGPVSGTSSSAGGPGGPAGGAPGSAGQGGAPRPAPSNKESSQGQGNKKNSGGNKKNNNKNNANKNSESEEGDSDENSSQQQDPQELDYYNENEIASDENVNNEADIDEDQDQDDDDEEQEDEDNDTEPDAHEEHDDEEDY